ncbi:MAG: cyclic nucleotide-binding domain-containing protein [Novosphingobium sp.]|nr:cyclic nucleotide-binding domain-containing protein [Novosphingobium sp.]MCB2077527.1 cyclic nucleotide-binding domain-containing protein [Novosphingobium sp.]
MTIETIGQILAKHPFFAEFQPEHVELVAGCARNVRFNPGEYLTREGGPADRFFLIRHGMVSLEVATPGRAPIVVTTLREGEIVGASWLAPPYRSMFDARAVELTRAISIDAECLRKKCEKDHYFGYEMMQSVLRVLVKRLQATRMQILDVYGE